MCLPHAVTSTVMTFSDPGSRCAMHISGQFLVRFKSHTARDPSFLVCIQTFPSLLPCNAASGKDSLHGYLCGDASRVPSPGICAPSTVAIHVCSHLLDRYGYVPGRAGVVMEQYCASLTDWPCRADTCLFPWPYRNACELFPSLVSPLRRPVSRLHKR